MIVETVQTYLRNNDEASFLDTILRSSSTRLPGTEAMITPQGAENMFVEMLFGSNETTSSTLCAILMRLYQNPKVVERVMEEVDYVVKKQGQCDYTL